MSPVPYIRQHPCGIELAVRVTPKAGSAAIAGTVRDAAGVAWLAVKVTEPADAGRATRAALLLVARHCGVAPSAVRLLAGATSRWKRVAVEGDAVLRTLAELPITTWRYRGEEPTRHMGPTAEEFHRRFGLGRGDGTIAAVDSDGVALAAIQALLRRLEERAKTKNFVELLPLPTGSKDLHRLKKLFRYHVYTRWYPDAPETRRYLSSGIKERLAANPQLVDESLARIAAEMESRPKFVYGNREKEFTWEGAQIPPEERPPEEHDEVVLAAVPSFPALGTAKAAAG